MQPQVRPFFHAPSNTYTYVVSDPVTRVAAVIDPCLDFDAKSGRTGVDSVSAVLDYLRSEDLQLRWILETHAHADHLSAGRWLKARQPQAALAIGRGIREVQQTFKSVFNLGDGFATDGSQFDQLFTDGEHFAIGELDAEVLATPGHTNDSVSYLIGDALFVGDTLFMPDSGSARADFPGGDARTLYRSSKRVLQLPDETRLFMCHDYGAGGDRDIRWETTVGEERAHNIHLKDGTSEDEFVEMREARDATLAMPRLIVPSLQVNMRAGRVPTD